MKYENGVSNEVQTTHVPFYSLLGVNRHGECHVIRHVIPTRDSFNSFHFISFALIHSKKEDGST